ncbi:MAG: hypothetical protein U5L11_11240 [Arhodomonas sp.]|nr:hypothetical protein [Arhodomonas sp.]
MYLPLDRILERRGSGSGDENGNKQDANARQRRFLGSLGGGGQ